MIGGVAISVDSTARELARMGHESFVFAPKYPGHVDMSDRVIRYPSLAIRYKVPYPLFLPSRAVDSLVADLRLDLVHSHHPWGIGKHALKLGRRLGLPVAFTFHTFYSAYAHYVPAVMPRRLMASLIERQAIRYANSVDLVIAPTRSVATYLESRIVKTPMRVVPTGVECPTSLQTDTSTFRDDHGIPRDHLLLMSLSRVGPEKNLPALVAAFALVCGQFPLTSLAIVGDGPGLDELKRVARRHGLADRVFFPGAIQPANRWLALKEADIFVHVSRTEAQGLALLEAMASGVPIVAMRGSGVVDLVRDGVNGLVTEPEPEAFAVGLRHLIRSSELRRRLSEEASRTAERFSARHTGVGLLNAYHDLLERHRSAQDERVRGSSAASQD